MQNCWIKAALALAAVVIAMPTQACVVSVQTNLNDIRFADVVVIGRIANYRIVQDEGFRWRRQQLARRDLPPDLRRRFRRQRSFLSDYARFNIMVDQVLVGRADRALAATWDNSTFSEPAMMPRGSYLIALRRPISPAPPLRGPSATVLPTPRDGLTLLQAPCASAFIFPIDSEEARTVRSLLGR
jgi:hypothetical protein